jgi:hypothetical protein
MNSLKIVCKKNQVTFYQSKKKFYNCHYEKKIYISYILIYILACKVIFIIFFIDAKDYLCNAYRPRTLTGYNTLHVVKKTRAGAAGSVGALRIW